MSLSRVHDNRHTYEEPEVSCLVIYLIVVSWTYHNLYYALCCPKCIQNDITVGLISMERCEVSWVLSLNVAMHSNLLVYGTELFIFVCLV